MLSKMLLHSQLKFFFIIIAKKLGYLKIKQKMSDNVTSVTNWQDEMSAKLEFTTTVKKMRSLTEPN